MGKQTDSVVTLAQLFAKHSLGSAQVWEPIIASVCMRNRPVGARPTDLPAWDEWCAINLRERIIDYKKKKFGDCGTATPVEVGKVATALRFGSAGVGSAATISALTLKTATGLSAGLGIASAGIGLLAIPLIGIFTHHAQAVAQEQTIACQVSVGFNSAAPSIDEGVASGQLTIEQGIQAMAVLTGELKKQLASIVKSCNLACGFTAFLDAHMDFARELYPKIAPSGLLSLAPDGVKQGVQAATQIAQQVTEQAQRLTAGISTNTLIGLAIATGVAFLFFGGRR